MRGPDIDGGRGPWGPLEDNGTAPLTKRGPDPGDQIWGYPAFPQHAGQSIVGDLVKSSSDVQEQRGDLEA